MHLNYEDLIHYNHINCQTNKNWIWRLIYITGLLGANDKNANVYHTCISVEWKLKRSLRRSYGFIWSFFSRLSLIWMWNDFENSYQPITSSSGKICLYHFNCSFQTMCLNQVLKNLICRTNDQSLAHFSEDFMRDSTQPNI